MKTMKTEELFLTLYKSMKDKEKELMEAEQFTYKLFVKKNRDLEFRENMTRKEFEDFREKHKVNFNVSGHVNFRNAEGTKYAVLEYKHFKPSLHPLYEYYRRQLIEAFIKDNNITKVEEFILFFEDYIETHHIELAFKISWFEQTYEDLCNIDEKLLNLFK